MLLSRNFGASKIPMRHDPHLLNYVLLLRFGKCTELEAPKPILNFQSIAKLIKKPVTTVIELVKAGLHASKFGLSEDKTCRSKLSQHHIGYLVSTTTL